MSNAQAISNAVAAVLAEHLGRGPSQTRTGISGDTITVVMHGALTVGERTLVDAGRSAEVLRYRETFQDILAPQMTGEVQRITGRTVSAFMSTNHIDPDLVVEVFQLAPGASGDAVP